MTRGMRVRSCVVLLLAGCTAATEVHSSGVVSQGADLYAQMCAGCHGSDGGGGRGPSLRDWNRDEPTLVDIIDRTMPKGDPSKCTGECARDVAAYILETFKSPACAGAELTSPRRLRLLTRREYRRTVDDLLPPVSVPASSCAQSFSYDPAGKTYRTVHVAGDFNNWAATVAGGGWALTLAAGKWTLSHELPAGKHLYKYVLDEQTWITDPGNAQHEPDNYGGQNSVVTVSCPAQPAGDVTAGFPVDSRPDGFAYDNDAAARVVTPVHIEEYVDAAGKLAARATTPVDVAAFGRRVFRRPLTADELTRYRALDPKQAVQALLSSPHFLYRSEMGEAAANGTYRLTAYETATALSYLFWGTTPDATLLDAAQNGELADGAGIEKHARRLLADARSREAVGRFALEWLGAESVLTVDKKPELFPGFDAPARQALADETSGFAAHVIFDGTHQLDELFTASYSWVGGKRVDVPAERQAGVLGHASVLASYAHSDQTSPVRRGLFVRRALLCQDLPPPPPNVPGVPEVADTGTTRDRFTMHSASDFCSSCHHSIDPIGFGFERFDPIGKVRDLDNGLPIDSSGNLNDLEGLGRGTSLPFATLPELGRAIAASTSAKDCFARQYYRFARGAHETVADKCTLDAIRKRFGDASQDIRELMIAVATSPDFVVRK